LALIARRVLPAVAAKAFIELKHVSPWLCSRYAKAEERIKIQTQLFSIILFEGAKRYNIAPNTPANVVALNGRSLVANELVWGVRGFDGQLLTNAKSETARTKRTWKDSWANRRCLIPATHYFEWRSEGPQKLPYCMTLKDSPLFWFAGLWSDEEGGHYVESRSLFPAM
jgi:putative SOS response-associated peptidase YedK